MHISTFSVEFTTSRIFLSILPVKNGQCSLIGRYRVLGATDKLCSPICLPRQL